MTTPNPADPADTRAAAEMIRDLAGSPDFDAVAMVNQLAPILARAYLESNPPLVWRRFEECGIQEFDPTTYQWKSGEDDLGGNGAGAQGFDLFGWHSEEWVTGGIWIACLASNGEPWPVRLAEVRE